MAKKIVRRKPAAKTTQDYTEVAWVREHGDVAECSCGKVKVEVFETDLVIRTQHGWIQESQWITCGVAVPFTKGCLERIRFSPRLVWEQENGDRYTIGRFLPEGDTENRKVN